MLTQGDIRKVRITFFDLKRLICQSILSSYDYHHFLRKSKNSYWLYNSKISIRSRHRNVTNQYINSLSKMIEGRLPKPWNNAIIIDINNKDLLYEAFLKSIPEDTLRTMAIDGMLNGISLESLQ